MSSQIEQIRLQFGRGYRQLREIWKIDGPRGVIDLLRRIISERVAAKNTVLPVLKSDVLAADISASFPVSIPNGAFGQQLTVNWVMTPPSPRSGGHTTLFRIIRRLQSVGYNNRVYFYNVYRGDHRYYESIIRRFYEFDGAISSLDEGMEDAHAVIATSWPTAYPIFNSRCRGKRFYFVQDFEPYFYPIGALSYLAENTYRMGFHGITAGRWLAQKLRADFDMPTDSFEFGSDASRYHRLENPRNGIVFYARPEAARRAFELGLMAIELFAARRPDIQLHFYGNKMGKLSFPFTDHGLVSPEELNDIYNRCYAGLSLSMTNASLVAHEMLAAGCIPVVNDAVHNRIVLDNPFVRYAPPYPSALAAELEALVTMHDFASLSRAAAESVRNLTWNEAGDKIDAIIRRTLEASVYKAADGDGGWNTKRA